MNYRIYTRPNQFGGVYVRLDINGKYVHEKYCGTDIGGRWYAYCLKAKVEAGKFSGDGTLYEGTIK